MKTPKNQNIKKTNRLGPIVLWSVFLVFLITSISFVSFKRKNISYENIQIEIDTSLNKFVSESEIIEILEKSKINLKKQDIDSINTAQIETTIENHPSIENAEVYFTFRGNLMIEIVQRKPILRIINQPKIDIYIDENEDIMPTSTNYTAHVLVATGHITKSDIIKYEESKNANSDEKDLGIIKKIIELSNFISSNKFWKSQIEHIEIDENKDFILIPRVGAHKVLLGDITNIEIKFKNLTSILMDIMT